jgi:hypothetical protein
MSNDNPQRLADDEIDLRPAARRFSRFISEPFILFRAHPSTVVWFVLTAILLSLVLKYTLPKSYRSSFIIRPNDRNEKFHLRIFGDIQGLLKQNDYEGIARELKVTPEMAESLLGIYTDNPMVHAKRDSVNYTEVAIITSDPAYIIPFQTALLNYLESNPYFQKIRELQGRQIKMNLDQVNRDLGQLDSLKRMQLKHYNSAELPSGSPVLLSTFFNPTASYSMTADRMFRKSALLAQEIFLDNFQLVKSCILVRHHYWPPRLLIMCSILVPVSLIFCWIYLGTRERNRKRKQTSVQS